MRTLTATKENRIEPLKVNTRKSNILAKDIKRNWPLYTMVIPVFLFYVIFMYKPMYGALIAFQDFSPGLGFDASPWVGFRNFTDFFKTPDLYRLVKNTIVINLASLIYGFPAPIILALLINELKSDKFKRLTQTFTYLPHFISVVVICGLVKNFVSNDGIITQFVGAFTGKYENMLNNKHLFVPIYVASSIWQEVGWGSIVYLAALSGVDPQLYEAAKIDGANKWKLLWHVTLPAIAPTIVIMLILRVGRLMSLGFEKIFLLYNPVIFETSDVISTYVYRMGLIEQQWSYTTAIGLLNSVINFILVVAANKISKHVSGTSLW